MGRKRDERAESFRRDGLAGERDWQNHFAAESFFGRDCLVGEWGMRGQNHFLGEIVLVGRGREKAESFFGRDCLVGEWGEGSQNHFF